MKKIICLLVISLLCSCEVKVGKDAVNKEENKTSNQYPMNANISFPLKPELTREYLQDNFWKCNYDTAGEDLKYWIILPKNIKPTNVKPINVGASLINIGTYQVINNDPYLEVNVYYEKLDQLIQPLDWLLSKLNASGDSIINKNNITTPEGVIYSDILTSKKMKDKEIISRNTVYRKRNLYFYVRADTDKKDYEGLSKNIFHITSNFGLEK